MEDEEEEAPPVWQAMRFDMSIQSGNAAFVPDPGEELARILRKIAEEVEVGCSVDYGEGGTIMDINGNKVGEWTLEPRP